MRQKTHAILAVATLLFAAMAATNTNVNAAGPAVIGFYERFGLQSAITEDDLEPTAGGLRLTAPPFSSKMAVEQAYLDALIPGWASDVSFKRDGAYLHFSANSVTFSPFSPSETPQFTFGSTESIKFVARPMWISLAKTDVGLKLEMDDGNTRGQDVLLSKAWLWTQGIHRPVIQHENGLDVEVENSVDNSAFVVKMPHFSFILIDGADIDVRGRQDGVMAPHVGTIEWDPQAKRLEVEVTQKFSTYDLLVESDWIDAHLPHPSLWAYQWVQENVSGTHFYVVSLPANQTPTLVTYEEFRPRETWIFTAGSPASYDFFTPMQVAIDEQPDRLKIVTDYIGNNTTTSGNILLNLSYLETKGYDHFRPANATGAWVSHVWGGGYLQVPADNDPFDDLNEAIDDGGLVVQLLEDVERSVDYRSDVCSEAHTLGLTSAKTWVHDNGEGASSATMYVYKGSICFEWNLYPGNQVPDPYWYMVNARVHDSLNSAVGCLFGTTSTTATKMKSGAGSCEWSDPETIDVAMTVEFYATAVSQTENERRYKAQASWNNCYTGGADANVPHVVAAALIGIGSYFGQKTTECAVRWMEKGVTHIIWDNGRPAEAVITDSGSNVQISSDTTIEIDHNVDGEHLDTWDWWEVDHGTDVGGQGLHWYMKNIAPGAKLNYDGDLSTVWRLDFVGSDIRLDRARDTSIIATAERDFQGTRTILFQMNWEAPDDECVPAFMLESLANQVWYWLEIGDLWGDNPDPLPCDPMAMQAHLDSPVNATFLNFSVLDSNLATSDVAQTNGSVTKAQINAANGSLYLAIARQVIANETILDGINSVRPVTQAAASVCQLHHTPYETKFRAEVWGWSTTEVDETRVDSHVVESTICFHYGPIVDDE